LKIVTWNCNGAFRKKFKNLTDLNADINIIQECENPAETKHKEYNEWAENYLWIGDTKNKGIGIFANKNIVLKKLNWSDNYENHKVKHFLPCSINGDFDLLAIWTHRNNSPNFKYIGQFWKYLQINKSRLNRTIIAGDLNSNAIWDEWDRWWNHSDVIKILSDYGIESLYHKIRNEQQGKEMTSTYFHQKNKEKPFHIDYIFSCKELTEKLIKLDIGKYEEWIKISDHVPIICEFEYKN
jgi:exonuclease III